MKNKYTFKTKRDTRKRENFKVLKDKYYKELFKLLDL